MGSLLTRGTSFLSYILPANQWLGTCRNVLPFEMKSTVGSHWRPSHVTLSPVKSLRQGTDRTDTAPLCQRTLKLEMCRRIGSKWTIDVTAVIAPWNQHFSGSHSSEERPLAADVKPNWAQLLGNHSTKAPQTAVKLREWIATIEKTTAADV